MAKIEDWEGADDIAYVNYKIYEWFKKVIKRMKAKSLWQTKKQKRHQAVAVGAAVAVL